MAENIQRLNKPFKIDKISRLSINGIAQFAGSRLIEEEVDGESFLMLTQSDLIQHLGFRLGPAVKLANAILLIKSQVCSHITKKEMNIAVKEPLMTEFGIHQRFKSCDSWQVQ